MNKKIKQLSTDPKDWQGMLCGEQARNIFAFSDDNVTESAWFEFAIPTCNQVGPSCMGETTANWYEMMLRRYVSLASIPAEMQIDGHAIWKRGREKFFNGTFDGGLYPRQAFLAALELDILPIGSIFRELNPNIIEISRQLQLTPLMQGHRIHDGWFRPSKVNGCIDHQPAPNAQSGAHATCMIAILRQGADLYVFGQNTWGREYGWNGYFCMRLDEWLEGYLGSGPFTIDLPFGWEHHEGWKKYLTRRV